MKSKILKFNIGKSKKKKKIVALNTYAMCLRTFDAVRLACSLTYQSA